VINISAPANAPESTILLPNPEWSDTITLPVEIRLKVMNDGTVYSYRSANTGTSYKWQFRLTRNKALELKDFVKLHTDVIWRVIGFGVNGLFILTTNPFTLSNVARGSTPISSETTEVEIELATYIP
jgi:hypothetical protein